MDGFDGFLWITFFLIRLQGWGLLHWKELSFGFTSHILKIFFDDCEYFILFFLNCPASPCRVGRRWTPFIFWTRIMLATLQVTQEVNPDHNYQKILSKEHIWWKTWILYVNIMINLGHVIGGGEVGHYGEVSLKL